MQIKSLASIVNAFFNFIEKVTATGKISLLRSSLNLILEKYVKKVSSQKLILAKIKKNGLKILCQKLVLVKKLVLVLFLPFSVDGNLTVNAEVDPDFRGRQQHVLGQLSGFWPLRF